MRILHTIFSGALLLLLVLVYACADNSYSIRTIFDRVNERPQYKLIVKWQEKLSERGWFDPWPREISMPAMLPVKPPLVAAGGRDGNLLLIDADSGKVLWKKHLPEPISGSPAFDGNRLIVGDGNGNLLALDVSLGKQIWSSYVSDQISGSPILHQGRIYFRTMSGKLGALDSSSGTKLWDYVPELPQRIMAFPFGGPVLAGNLLVSGMPDAHIVALSAENGQRVWETTVETKGDGIFDPPSAPVYSEELGRIFVAMYDAGVVALSADDGSILWHSQKPARAVGVAMYDDSMLLVSSPQDGLCALSPQDGSKLWCMDLCTGAKFGPSVPVVWDKRVLLSCNRDETGVYIVDGITSKTAPKRVVLFAPGKGVFMPALPIGNLSFVVISNAGYAYRVKIAK